MKPSPRISLPIILRWTELVLLVVLFSGVLILINIISYKHSRRFDLTPGKRYTLAPQSEQLLKNLTDDLTVTIFYKKGEGSEYQDLLQRFSRVSGRFHYSVVDLDKNPATAQSLGIREYGSGVAEYKGRKETIRYVREESLITTILRLSDNRVKTVRFVTGHGEKSITSGDKKNSYSDIKKALEAENYRVEELLLLQADKIPDDTLILVIGVSQKDFFQKELDLIDAYIKKGGRVMFLCDPSSLPRLENYVKQFSVELPHDFIIDREQKLVELDEMTPLIFPARNHPITSAMTEAVVFPWCRSVMPAQKLRDDLDITIFATSGQGSWAERDTKSVYDGKARFDRDADMPGPVPVAVAIEGKPVVPAPGQQQNKKAPLPLRLAIAGNSNFISNHYLNILGNKDFFLNTVNWLAERPELPTIRPKTEQQAVSMLFLTENENKLILWSAVIVEPALILLAGIAVMVWRRMRR